jgi:EmrB/QacA subfamily drug resistance transporter
MTALNEHARRGGACAGETEERPKAGPLSKGEAAVAAAESRPLARAEVRKIFFGLMLAMFLAALNQTIISTALPTIGRDFADFENLAWIVTAYLLTSTAVAPLYGKLSDVYGRRAMMLTGIGVFIAGSCACAAAPNMALLVAGRALQGLGGGGILPLGQAIMADTVAPRERGRYQAYMGIVWVGAGVGGPVLGGFLAEHWHWSLVFWINVPLGLAAALMSSHTLKRLPQHDRPHQLDLLGAALMMLASVALLLALTWGGTRYAWGSPVIVTLVVASLALTAAFSWWLTRAPEPFLPLAVLKNPVMRMGTMATAFAMAASIGLTIFVPLYFELVHHLSASDSGLALIPLAALTTPGSVLSGQVMMRRRHYKWVPIVVVGVSIAALAVLIARPALPLLPVMGILGLSSVAIGSVYPVATVSIQNAVALSQVGVAMGAMNFFRALVSAFAVAVMGAIVLAGFGETPQRGTGASVVTAATTAPGDHVAHVFGFVFLAAAVCLALSLIAVCAMEERPLRSSVRAPAPAEGSREPARAAAE